MPFGRPLRTLTTAQRSEPICSRCRRSRSCDDVFPAEAAIHSFPDDRAVLLQSMRMNGAVLPPVSTWLRLEGAAVLVAAVTAYVLADFSWVLFALLILAPDVSFVGYVAGPRAGSVLYNVTHSYVGPALLLCALLLAGSPLAIPLIWGTHIAFDRVVGYGLKYPSAFQDTHLGRIRRKQQ